MWSLTGFCGLLCPLCLECDVARHHGECFCWPLLPGSTFALRVGTRERHKIREPRCEESARLSLIQQQNGRAGGTGVWCDLEQHITHAFLHPGPPPIDTVGEDRFICSPMTLSSWRPARWGSCPTPDVQGPSQGAHALFTSSSFHRAGQSFSSVPQPFLAPPGMLTKAGSVKVRRVLESCECRWGRTVAF